jgi:hypothetical protein
VLPESPKLLILLKRSFFSTVEETVFKPEPDGGHYTSTKPMIWVFRKF